MALGSFLFKPHHLRFIDKAYEEAVPVAFLTAYSMSGEKIARFVSIVNYVLHSISVLVFLKDMIREI